MIDRHLWVHALSAVPENDIKSAADKAKRYYTVRHLTLPEEGLGLLKMKDGAYGEPYYLGEFPVASAHVALTNDNGETSEGGAHVMHDSSDYAADLAVCDAILAGRLTGWQGISRLLESGMQKRKTVEQKRKSMLARTRVNFDLLSEVKDESDEN